MGTLIFSSRLFFCLLLVTLVSLSRHRVGSQPTQDKQALLDFLSQTPHESRVRWNSNDSACNWVGVKCNPTKSYVYSLRLPGVGLIGRIPPNTIGRLSQLRVLSLRSNRLSGQIPSDFSNLTVLRSLYLQGNVFSGEFPPSLTELTRLTRLDISRNNFSGPIPFGINNLTRLTRLYLQENKFSSSLPSINLANLQGFNVSNNQLNGPIPGTLSKFPEAAFRGNLQLCGPPLAPCESPFSPTSPPSEPPQNPPSKNSSKGLSKIAIIAIAVGLAVVLLLLLLILSLCLRKRLRRTPSPPKTVKETVPRSGVPESAEFATTSSSKDELTSGSGGVAERNKLVFADGAVLSFDLEDLLRASAEVLGKGSVGTSYKAVLEEGTTVVVKRLKDVAVGKKEFENVMAVLGKVKHENVVPLRAYYYSKDEKLLVYDYLANGNLSALLHGSRGSGRTPLVWDQRLKIGLSAGRGIAHLHTSGKVVHGNIKSSNILVRPDQTAAVSDFGLNPLFGTSTPPSRVAGYRAPEAVETRKVTQKSDVYSFGVLLLELLTGKAPNQASLGEEGIDLPRWVQSVVREEWTAEVFDVELMRYQNIEDEMVQLLQIAMACVAPSPDQRPVMADVVRMMEEMNRGSNDDGPRQWSDEPSRESDTQTPPQELRSSPRGVTP